MKLIDKTRSSYRLRVRRVDEDFAARITVRKARKTGEWAAEVRHGGDVANKYPALTECALAVANPSGVVVVWLTRAQANKVTERGAAEACLTGSGALWDGRVTRQERRDDAWAAIKAAFAEEMPIVDQLAALAHIA